MQIGKMRERVTLQQETRTADEGGGYAKGWSNIATVWAQVRPIQGREQLEHQKVEDSTLYRVFIRYRAGLTPGNRLFWRNTPLNIRAITNPDEKRAYLEIVCEAGVAQ